jgi:hypothetical protein
MTWHSTRNGPEPGARRTTWRLWALACLLPLCWSTVAAAQGEGPPFLFPKEFALESDGNLVVMDRKRPALLRVDRDSGDRQIISDNQVGTGPKFVLLIGVAVEDDGNIIAVDAQLDAVLRVDPLTGDRTVVSDADHGEGPDFVGLSGVHVNSDGDILIPDQLTGALFLVDPISGDRTVVTSTPSCILVMEKRLYEEGQGVVADSLRVANLAPDPRNLRLKVFFADPSGETHVIVDKGGDGSFEVPQETIFEFGPRVFFSVRPDTPSGTWTLACEVYDVNGTPSGVRVDRETASFSVVGVSATSPIQP